MPIPRSQARVPTASANRVDFGGLQLDGAMGKPPFSFESNHKEVTKAIVIDEL